MKQHKIIIQNAAKKDATESRRWYENQQKGLGKRFVNDLKITLSRIASNPFSYTIRHEESRKANLLIFPYGVFFFIDENTNTVFVIAIKHNARNL